MNPMKKAMLLLAMFVTLAASASVARAANESINLELQAEPNAGPLFKEVYRPLDASLTVTVSNPPSETLITPLKVANVRFPREMEFFPNPARTPVCPPEKLNETSNLSAGVIATVAQCPRSVIGTGSAVVQLAKAKESQPGQLPAVTDPKFVIFNAGRDEKGRPKLLIYGYSRTVNSGLLMRGTLAANRDLKINIGVLPFDSSVSRFTLGIPGEPLEITGEGNTEPVTVKGLDPTYLRGTCATGNWRATGAFVLGERDHPSGTPAGPSTFLRSNAFDLPCQGRKGKAKLKIGRITGPATTKPNRDATFNLRVSNQGTATARRVSVSVSGAAKGRKRVGDLRPGGSGRIKVTVKTGKPAAPGILRFRVTANETVRKEAVRKLTVG